MYIWFNRFCTLKIIQHNGPGGDKCDVLSETFIYADVNESYDVKCKYGYEHFRLSILVVHILFIHGFYIKLRYHMNTWPPSSSVSPRSGKEVQNAFNSSYWLWNKKVVYIQSYGVLLFGDALCIPRSIVILQNYDLTAILAQPREFSAHCKLL